MARATSKGGFGQGWRKQSGRHSNARKYGHAGGRYATIPPPPLKSSNNLPVQVSMIVPSTKNVKGKSVDISDRELAKRVNETKKEFDVTFGGDSAISEVGSYYDGEKLVNERGVIVESSTSIPKYKKNIKKISEFVEKKRQDYNQQTMAVKVEGRLFVTPKQDFIADDKKTKNKMIPVT